MGQTLPCRRERCVVKVKLEDADCGLSIIKEEIKNLKLARYTVLQQS
jgi:hypothetical protein